MIQLPEPIKAAWEAADYEALQAALKEYAGQMSFPQTADAVRYTDDGILFEKDSLSVTEPASDEVVILPVAVSLCGTDIALIDKAHAGQLPDEAIGKVVGHEAAGFVVAVGDRVSDWRPGQLVCLDSHFACHRDEHPHFDSCVASGESCDGIVGGIRGAMKPDGSRLEPRDGYWTELITAPASALPIELPVTIAKHLAAPSTLESLGNIYMIAEQMKELGLTDQADDTLVVVSGLGATGYPMAAVATHYGFEVVGVNPSESKRSFALEQGVVQVASDSITIADDRLADKKNVVVIVTAGAEAAHQNALDWLEQTVPADKRRVAIIFGLFSDPDRKLPHTPDKMDVSQRDFVFSRHSFTTDNQTEVYGVCGRNLAAWKSLMADLQPSADGIPPRLLEQLNRPIHVLAGASALEEIATELNKGSKSVASLLKGKQALKLAAHMVQK